MLKFMEMKPARRRLSKEDKKNLIEKIAGVLNNKDFIAFAYIFGSFISKEDFNDIDVAIFISDTNGKSPLILELEIETELENIIGIPVDIRIINNAPLSFTYNALKNCRVIVDKDRDLRTDFESLIYKKYMDFQHLRKEYLKEIVNAPI